MRRFLIVFFAFVTFTLGVNSASAVTFTPDSANGSYDFDISFEATRSFSSGGFLGFIVRDFFLVPGTNSNVSSTLTLAEIFINGVSVNNNCTCDLGTNGTTGPGVVVPNDFLFAAFADTININAGDILRFVANNIRPDTAQGTINPNPGPAFLMSPGFQIGGVQVDTTPIPLPATLPLLAIGTAIFGALRVFRRNG